MADFETLYRSFDPDPSKRGKQFEHFIKWFLKNEPEWATQVDEVWLWGDYPDRWGGDCGIDLVFRHKNGETWAVQAKCYSPDHQITKSDVDKFISESSRGGINKRLLIGTTDRIGVNAKRVIEAQEKTVVRYLRSNFESAEIEYPARFDDLKSGRRREPPAPRPHQIEAINAVEENFKNVERGQLIMACGTGKTFTMLWIKERMGARRTLVLLPSLGLLSQTLSEWTFAAKTPFDALCVCSDQTVGNRGEDEAIHSVADLAFPVTSNVDEIRRFLEGDKEKVIFSTYQSSRLIADAQSDSSIPVFDLAVADEAHRCAGKDGTVFSTVLDSNRIRARKRLFATATPRTYSLSVKKAAEDRGVDVVGMDNSAVFGNVLYSLPFGDAIKKGLLTDYRVVIIGVDDPTIGQWIERRELLRTETGIETDAQSLASQIGLLKAICDYDLRRIISFHNRVSRASEFAGELPKIVNWIGEGHCPNGKIMSDFVSGAMPADERRMKLDKLRSIKSDERAVLANARCLAEGVDVPSLDGIAFIDPRSSRVDIIQAVGRAIRLSPDKKVGIIVIPVFIKDGENAETSIEASNFKPVWEVLNALKSHDEVLSHELDRLRTELGQGSGYVIEDGAFTKITIDLPAMVDVSFGASLRTYLVESTTSSWEFWYGLLLAFVKTNGHARVPRQHKTADGFNLRNWVATQRINKDGLSLERKERLGSLPGWSWNLFEDDWNKWFEHLQEFVQTNGHARVPRQHKTADGFNLGKWVGKQRASKDGLSLERKERLGSLPGWSWDPFEDDWNKGFEHLQEFVQTNGHARVPDRHKTADGFNLRNWVGRQRTNKDGLSLERKERLGSLPGWSWDPLEDDWNKGFEHLQEFVKIKGDARVPASHKTADEFNLGSWVTTQRINKDGLSLERKERLESLPGWSWDPLEDDWNKWFERLEEFVKIKGDARVRFNNKTADGFNLGKWVGKQRASKDGLSLERKERLGSLPGWSWDPFEDYWNKGFGHLQEFMKIKGDARVPDRHKTVDGFKLGNWVGKQRTNKDGLSLERKERLGSLPGWSWDPFEDAWNEGFKHLQEFVKPNGDARVPRQHKTADGFKLGNWVKTQRTNKDGLSQDRKNLLESLDGWAWSAKKGL